MHNKSIDLTRISRARSWALLVARQVMQIVSAEEKTGHIGEIV